MKRLLIFFILLTCSVSVFAQTEWKIDPYHSSINFTIEHSGISMVSGKFTEYSGELTTKGETLENARFDFTVQVESINTGVDQRDNHLRSGDFFEADAHPTMSFESTRIEKTDDPEHYKLYGNLTIKGVTKEVVADLYYGGTATTDQGEKMGMRAEATINRFDYGIDYDPTAAGIGKEVHIVTHLQFVKQ
ncbi:YceI family protein [Roseivirga sp. BDSF3-8]|uniref:YceI family protein n=1 Tax=Roseivirga sp. BDSF3-8 TaxID=3241598 RepID=UPI003531DE9C